MMLILISDITHHRNWAKASKMLVIFDGMTRNWKIKMLTNPVFLNLKKNHIQLCIFSVTSVCSTNIRLTLETYRYERSGLCYQNHQIMSFCENYNFTLNYIIDWTCASYFCRHVASVEGDPPPPPHTFSINKNCS